MSDAAHKIPASPTGTDFAISLEAGNSRAIPWNALAEMHFPASALNSSTVNIVAGGSFPGQVESGARQSAVQVAVFADQPYRVEIVQYSDAGGTRETARSTFRRLANEGFAESILLVDWYFRVIVTNLNAGAATTVFTCQTSQGGIPAMPKSVGPYGGLPVEITGRGEELKHYFASRAVIPTATTSGLNLFFLRNPSATKVIKLQKVEALLYFVGTAAATRSMYVLQKLTGVTASPAGTNVVVEKGNTAGSASIAECKWNPAGTTISGSGGAAGQNIASLGHPNQLIAGISYDRDMADAPIILNQNELVVLRTDGAIVAGSTVHLALRWVEDSY
jgi:hypothetical protein